MAMRHLVFWADGIEFSFRVENGHCLGIESLLPTLVLLPPHSKAYQANQNAHGSVKDYELEVVCSVTWRTPHCH
jgi:hypothetical protein